ncbi:MAG: LemA family protein [Mycoplasmatota bacterium]|nr:LemA family protein [Mycoplasmatota bacterium]
MIALIIIGVVVLVIVIWYISTSNALNRAVVKIDEANSGIDVALTKRYDVLTKMLETVKGYAKHEKETIVESINLRKGMTLPEKTEINNKMTDAFTKLNVVAENYPDLKASENFKALQLSIADVEEHLQAARRLYNANVSTFNQMIVTFPTSIIANSKGLTKKDFFEVEENKKQDVEIKF